ncbi:myosin-M heavy chain-like [Tetranychus urticae]|uniref:CCDC66 domain-containing protein n=1 Tax=Tetranychus urticae TaxID=32264 RepID=T1K3D4_TETUR|nr:myosin-M heavy chain-like [Tetranychus urticae]
MDNITLSKNQLQAILELVSQIGSNRSQNVSVTSVTPTWERRPLDVNGNDDYCTTIYNADGDTNTLDNPENSINTSNVGDNFLCSTSMETIQSNNETLFWKAKGENDLTRQQVSLSSSALESPIEYPYFSNSSPSHQLVKSQSLGAIEFPFKPAFPKEPVTGQPLSLKQPRTVPSTSHSLLSFGSSQGSPVNFRRYTRNVTSSFGSIFGGGDPVDWNEKRQKILKYRAELSAQKEEKERREKEEKEKTRQEEEVAEKRMLAVQRRLKDEYEMEKRLIEEKREIAEKRRLAVIAAMEQAKNRGKQRKDSQGHDNDQSSISQNGHISVATQTDRYHFNTTNNSEFSRSDIHCKEANYCSSSAQTDISLLFDLIRSLGFSTMTLKCPSDEDDDGDNVIFNDAEGNSKLLRYMNLKGVRTPNNLLNRTARPRVGKSGLKFELNDNLTGSKRSEFMSKSASHTNLTRIDKSRLDTSPDKSTNRLKMASSSSNIFSNETKQNRVKSSSKKQPTSNLPLISDNQLPKHDFVSSARKVSKSTLEGIL